MKKNIFFGAIIATAVSGATVAGASNDQVIEEHKEVSAHQALQTAFSRVEGFVKEVELSFEDDENQYEVEIESSTNQYEFHVDAASGKIVWQNSKYIHEEDNSDDPNDSPSSEDDSYLTEIDDVSSLEEFKTIADQISTENLTFFMSTDNPGNRVMFLMDENGEKRFKTIFVKYNSYLKIIDLDGGGEMYYGKLK